MAERWFASCAFEIHFSDGFGWFIDGGSVVAVRLGSPDWLSLGLLPSDQLLACSLEGRALNGQESRPQNDAVAIADLLSSSEAQTGLDHGCGGRAAGPMAGRTTRMILRVWILTVKILSLWNPVLLWMLNSQWMFNVKWRLKINPMMCLFYRWMMLNLQNLQVVFPRSKR